MNSAPPASPPILHQVFFWMKRPGSTEDRAALIAGLQGLAHIPEVRFLRIGTPAATESRDVVDASFGVSELMMFDTLQDQKAYQDHPLHRSFVETCSHLWDRVVVYDSVSHFAGQGTNRDEESLSPKPTVPRL